MGLVVVILLGFSARVTRIVAVCVQRVTVRLGRLASHIHALRHVFHPDLTEQEKHTCSLAFSMISRESESQRKTAFFIQFVAKKHGLM